jgi:rubrerythrin
MDEKKQIEEMAKVIARRSAAFRNPNVAFMTTATKTAESLYNTGYRKQSEGEWVGTHNLRHCSKCGNVVNFNNVSSWLYNYCPNCGAKMKGV